MSLDNFSRILSKLTSFWKSVFALQRTFELPGYFSCNPFTITSDPSASMLSLNGYPLDLLETKEGLEERGIV